MLACASLPPFQKHILYSQGGQFFRLKAEEQTYLAVQEHRIARLATISANGVTSITNGVTLGVIGVTIGVEVIVVTSVTIGDTIAVVVFKVKSVTLGVAI